MVASSPVSIPMAIDVDILRHQNVDGLGNLTKEVADDAMNGLKELAELEETTGSRIISSSPPIKKRLAVVHRPYYTPEKKVVVYKYGKVGPVNHHIFPYRY